jgi:hypothetical protein
VEENCKKNRQKNKKVGAGIHHNEDIRAKGLRPTNSAYRMVLPTYNQHYSKDKQNEAARFSIGRTNYTRLTPTKTT